MKVVKILFFFVLMAFFTFVFFVIRENSETYQHVRENGKPVEVTVDRMVHRDRSGGKIKTTNRWEVSFSYEETDVTFRGRTMVPREVFEELVVGDRMDGFFYRGELVLDRSKW